MLCAQVVEKLIRGLAMEDSRNMFALFEHNNTIDKAVESRVLVADVLAKFERWLILVFVTWALNTKIILYPFCYVYESSLTSFVSCITSFTKIQETCHVWI